MELTCIQLDTYNEHTDNEHTYNCTYMTLHKHVKYIDRKLDDVMVGVMIPQDIIWCSTIVSTVFNCIRAVSE